MECSENIYHPLFKPLSRKNGIIYPEKTGISVGICVVVRMPKATYAAQRCRQTDPFHDFAETQKHNARTPVFERLLQIPRTAQTNPDTIMISVSIALYSIT